MAGWLVLHPVSQAHLGMGLFNIRPHDQKKTVYLIPSGDMVGEVHRQLERAGMDQQAVSVHTFDRFVRLMASAHPRTLMTPVEQEWLVRQAVSRVEADGKLHHHRHMVNKSGWLTKVEGRIGEVKRTGIRPGRLLQIWNQRGLHLMELGLIYQAYQELLQERRLWDHEEPYLEGMERMRRGEAPLPQRIVVEHVPDLSVLQEQWLIQAVTQGVEVSLHLPWDHRRLRLFRETARTVERFRRRGFRVIKQQDAMSASAKTPLLHHVEEQLFLERPQIQEGDPSIQVVAAAGVEEEVDRMVARLKEWLYHSNRPLSEVAILTQQPERYHPLLFPRLQRAGLPIHTSYRMPLASHPMAKTVALALRLKGGYKDAWRHLLDSPYLPGSPSYRMRAQWRRLFLDGEVPSKWEDQLEDAEHPNGVESFRAFLSWLQSAPVEQTWAGWLHWFEEWLRPLRPQAKTGTFPMEEWQAMAADCRAWEGLMEIRSEWGRIFEHGRWGTLSCDWTSFVAALEGALEKSPLTVTPGRRGGIRILEPNQVRGRRFAAVFLLGCAEGCWPRPIAPDWLVPDEERLRLRGEGVELATAEEQRNRQWVPFFQSMQAAEETLILSFPAADEAANPILPSPFLQELTRVVPSLQKQLDPAPMTWRDCATAEQGLSQALSQVNREALHLSPNWEGWRQVLPWNSNAAKVRIWAARVQTEQFRWGPLYTAFDGVLASSIQAKAIRSEMEDTVWSATSLNQAMQCPFHYFAARLLRLTPVEGRQTGLTPMERGEIMHRILCRFWDRYRDQPDKLLQKEEPMSHLKRVSEQVWREEAERKGWAHMPVWVRLEARRLLLRLEAMVEHEQLWRGKEGATASFRPRWLEWGFGLGRDEAALRRGEADPDSLTSPVALRLNEAVSIRIRGKVDRVDMDEAGRYILYDYKSGAAPSARDVIAGYHLQLPLYLWILEQEQGLNPEQAVGAAFYTSGTRKGDGLPGDNRNQGLWRKEEAQQVGISSRVGGLLEKDAWEQVQQALRQKILQRLQELKSGRFAVAPMRACPSTCPHRTICRIDRLRMSGKEGGKSDETDVGSTGGC
ncbi:PD-(D/E)XK nuclease family protein [Desmospora activa]|uniref:ATP-dependent helicase/DNAse subunit B n=1 Tax=Desmospora activa DSM 45169 TaxID=1121389 RepID=A0A2T4ZCT0_9BACL|nr:PD-(D/E)XK nuclease family protein [Desmospora activa]PTM59689.1 ATP-dependent helicase/DNAse subunit B [Desmospora activa DSM 45169]